MQHKLDLSSKGPHRRENVTKHSICYERVTAMVTRAYDKGHVALRDSNYLGNVIRKKTGRRGSYTCTHNVTCACEMGPCTVGITSPWYSREVALRALCETGSSIIESR